MQPRQLRVGDLVDDYCPRERRLSNHAVVALVGDDIRQIRCTTCDAEHGTRAGRCRGRKKKPGPGRPRSPGTRGGGAPGRRRCPAGREQPAPAGRGRGRARRGGRAATRRRRPARAENEAPLAPRRDQPAPPADPRHAAPHRERRAGAADPGVHDAPRAPPGTASRHGKPFRTARAAGSRAMAQRGGFGQGRHGPGRGQRQHLRPPAARAATARSGGAARRTRGGPAPPGGPGGHGGHGGHGPRHPRPAIRRQASAAAPRSPDGPTQWPTCTATAASSPASRTSDRLPGPSRRPWRATGRGSR